MSCLEHLKAQALELGFSGAEIGRYVVQQQTMEREERVLKRDERRSMKDLEEEERKRKEALEAKKLE